MWFIVNLLAGAFFVPGENLKVLMKFPELNCDTLSLHASSLNLEKASHSEILKQQKIGRQNMLFEQHDHTMSSLNNFSFEPVLSHT